MRAKEKRGILSAGEIGRLFPRKGNLHEFRAGEGGAAVLDVLMPPYGNDRDCTYYAIGGDCVVEKVEQPSDFRCSGGRYKDLGE